MYEYVIQCGEYMKYSSKTINYKSGCIRVRMYLGLFPCASMVERKNEEEKKTDTEVNDIGDGTRRGI